MQTANEASASASSAIAAIASKATYGGATTAGAGWFLSNEFIGLAGLVVAVIGLAVNWHFKAKHDSRLEAEHEATMKRLTDGD